MLWVFIVFMLGFVRLPMNAGNFIDIKLFACHLFGMTHIISFLKTYKYLNCFPMICSFIGALGSFPIGSNLDAYCPPLWCLEYLMNIGRKDKNILQKLKSRRGQKLISFLAFIKWQYQLSAEILPWQQPDPIWEIFPISGVLPLSCHF